MNPIFVSGIGRSGTSALLKAITQHKDVYAPDSIGEAPFLKNIIQFLLDYEDTNVNKAYHLANYKLSVEEKNMALSQLMFHIQNGVKESEVNKKYWVAKLTPALVEFRKCHEIFGSLRSVGIVRNGIEVVNSAKSFDGFADLTFEQLCHRWVTNLGVTEYLGNEEQTCMIRHIDLVSEPEQTFEYIFDKLNMEHDPKPGEFISQNIFNSSFDQKNTKASDLKIVFENRANCWFDWSDLEKDTFIELCDERMQEFDFRRPYASKVISIDLASNDKATDTESVSSHTPKIRSTKLRNKPQVDLSETITASLGKNEYSYLIDYHCNISEKYSYVFWENPKVGSTTLLAFLQSQEDSVQAQMMKNSHQRGLSPLKRLSNFQPDIQDQILFGQKYFKCAFVRNPYSRLLSAYKSKIEKNLPAKYEILSVLHNENDLEKLDLGEVIGFEQFVEIVCSQTLLEMNSHWKLQKYQIHADVIAYDFIGKLENTAQDIQSLTGELFDKKVKNLPVSKNATDARFTMDKYYDSRLANLVFEKFEEDFDMFGYESNLLCHAA